MTDENQDVERITKIPDELKTQAKKKEKDPKRVAAGKRLAEYNKKAKEAKEKEMKRAEEESTDEGGGSWFPELSFITVLSLVGIGFSAINPFSRFYKNDSEITLTPVTRIASENLRSKEFPPPPPNTPVPQHRMGMA